jgi:hypothetical protein
VRVKEKYHIKISNRFATLENLNDDDECRLQWDVEIKASATDGLGYYDMKLHKPQYNEECSQL